LKKKTLKFYGEIFDQKNNKYYSALAGKKYREKSTEHLNVGHFQGYRFAIDKLSEPGDSIFDPTVGSGTAIIEAINNGRKGYGVELEWPDLCKRNCEFQKSKEDWKVYPGNAFYLLDLVKEKEFQLILNGTPYPAISNITSDSPFVPGVMDGKNQRGYEKDDSFGNLKFDSQFKYFITKMYGDCIKLLKKDGYLVLIIKDMIRNKKPFYFQKAIIEWILEENKNMEDHGFFIHKHVPETFFIRSYLKRFPTAILPKYQVGYILKKIGE